MALEYMLVPLIDRPELFKQSIALLNKEWPRSEGSREHSQKKSTRSKPPMSFLLLENNELLIGHARVCLVPNRPTACYVESVIIAKDRRGNGLGKRLMTMLEEKAKEFGYNQMFLTTEDQVEFYKRCGYNECEPIVYSTVMHSIDGLFNKLQLNAPENVGSPKISENKSCPTLMTAEKCANAPPPPPPPPKVMVSKACSTKDISTIDHQFMCKFI